MCSSRTSTASEPRKQSLWDLRWSSRRFTVTLERRWEIRLLQVEDEDAAGLMDAPGAETKFQRNLFVPGVVRFPASIKPPERLFRVENIARPTVSEV